MENLVLILMMLCVGLLGLGMMGVGWLMAQAARNTRADDAELAMRGVKTEAKIVERTSSYVARGRTRYFLTYEYTAPSADGKTETFTQKIQTNYQGYDDFREGDTLNLRYLPDKPKTIHIDTNIMSTDSAERLGINSAVLVIAGIAVIFIAIAGAVGFSRIGQKNADATATAEARLATPNPAQQAATAQADNAIVQKISDLIAARLPNWKKVSDQAVHSVPKEETGLGMGEVRIDYGYCDGGHFYVYVWMKEEYSFYSDNSQYAVYDGYAYIEGANPRACFPHKVPSATWISGDYQPLANNWYSLYGFTMEMP